MQISTTIYVILAIIIILLFIVLIVGVKENGMGLLHELNHSIGNAAGGR